MPDVYPRPTPYATQINLSTRQQQILEQITQQTTNTYRLVRRAQLILGADQGEKNTKLSAQLKLSRNQVQAWRDRWQQAAATLRVAEENQSSDLKLRQLIEGVLSDKFRPGTKAKFSVEQITLLVALACELPASSGHPTSHWTPRELTEEAVKRGIALADFAPQCGAFFKARSPCNRIECATGLTLTPRIPLSFERKCRTFVSAMSKPRNS